VNRGADADQVQQMVAVARQAEQIVARGREVFSTRRMPSSSLPVE